MISLLKLSSQYWPWLKQTALQTGHQDQISHHMSQIKTTKLNGNLYLSSFGKQIEHIVTTNTGDWKETQSNE